MDTDRSDPNSDDSNGLIGAQLDGLIDKIRQLQPLIDRDRVDSEPGQRFQEGEPPPAAVDADALAQQIDQVIRQTVGTAPSAGISDTSSMAAAVGKPSSAPIQNLSAEEHGSLFKAVSESPADKESPSLTDQISELLLAANQAGSIRAVPGASTAESVEQVSDPPTSECSESAEPGPSPMPAAMATAIASSLPSEELPLKAGAGAISSADPDAEVALSLAVTRSDQLVSDADTGAGVPNPDSADRPDDKSTSPNVTELDEPIIGGFLADATSVAQELDEQTEMSMPRQPEKGEKADGVPARRSRGLGQGFVTGAVLLKHACRILSVPFQSFSTSVQNLVGYIGLILVFPGVIMFCYGLAKRLFGS